MLFILLILNPYQFGSSGIIDSHLFIVIFFISSVFIPLVAIGLMKPLGFINSFEMKERHERIGPYIITGLLYIWLFQNLINNPDVPRILSAAVLGACIGLFLSFFLNNFTKISIHCTGMGGLIAFCLLLIFLFDYNQFSLTIGSSNFEIQTSFLFIIIVLISGLVGSARLILNAHNMQDVYGGFIVGFSSQIIAFNFLF